MNDIDRACAAFRTLLEEQQARVAGMTAEQVDYTNKAPVPIGLVAGAGIGTIYIAQAVRALEALLHGGERVADLGSGSGILSVSALRLGAASAVGVDIDPSAEHIAAANAAQNGFGPDRFTARTGDVVEDADFLQALAGDGFDIVCANIVADVIIRLAPVVPKLMRPDAAFVCSGILTTREDDVRAALAAAGLEIVHAAHEGEWCGLTARLGER